MDLKYLAMAEEAFLPLLVSIESAGIRQSTTLFTLLM